MPSILPVKQTLRFRYMSQKSQLSFQYYFCYFHSSMPMVPGSR